MAKQSVSIAGRPAAELTITPRQHAPEQHGRLGHRSHTRREIGGRIYAAIAG